MQPKIYISTDPVRFIYDFFIFSFHSGIKLASLFNNRKAKQWVDGRKDWENKINSSIIKEKKSRIWFHCASLGEFEQGRTLIEKLKTQDPSIFIVLTFFSPSGYEQRKNYPFADVVCYLPMDTAGNAKYFVNAFSPTCAIFVKYEFWYHYFKELRKNNIQLYMISVIFRPSQIFFKWYGIFYRNILMNVNHFFVQDKNSSELLANIGFTNVTVAGDTRFDRVYSISKEKKKIEIIEKFMQLKQLFVAGSTWPEDEEILLSVVNFLISKKYKIIIAPHEVSENRIEEIIKIFSKQFNKSEIQRYSKITDPDSANVLIIDNIGMLSSVYSYGNIAWIGGGFGKGIHNILEASAFGLPVLFGPNYKKFREAVELIKAGGAFSVNNPEELIEIVSSLIIDKQKLMNSAKISENYVNSQLGATNKIIESLSLFQEK